MEAKEAQGLSNGDESYIESECVAMQANDGRRWPCLKFYSLPESLRGVVFDYVSYNEREVRKLALLGEKRIALCLSQHTDLEIGFWWQFGYLSQEDRWESPMNSKPDKRFHIKDYQGCLDFLGRENSADCFVVIEVLLLRLDGSAQDLSSVLDDLQYTLAKLKKHLNSVQHVVLVVEKYTFCCFSFKDVVDNATGRRQHAVDRLLALTQILGDLRTCWENNHTLSTMVLIEYYILKDDKPESEVYLSKFVISVSHCRNRDLFDAVDPIMKPNKLKWIYCFDTDEDLEICDQIIARRCHAFSIALTSHGHVPATRYGESNGFVEASSDVYCFEDNPLIERIYINCSEDGDAMKLPRLRAPITNSVFPSALIELSLDGNYKLALDLKDLNNGYFQNLVHLSFFGGIIKGHLDSQRVPRLRTLRIEPGSQLHRYNSAINNLIQERVRSIIEDGRPWQFVAAQLFCAWSLALYEEPIANPQEDVKEEFPYSPAHPLSVITELLFMANCEANIDEWQVQLTGDLSVREDAGDPNNRLLVWAPERVKKITAFNTADDELQWDFKESIPGRTRSLTSLTCCRLGVVIDGGVLPQLQSLELIEGWVTLSGFFPNLQKLSFQETNFQSPWHMDAPFLHSLECDALSSAEKLSLNLPSLPLLSLLKFTPRLYATSCPNIMGVEESLGLSHVNRVVFSKDVDCSFVNQCHVNRVSDLELSVSALQLPACWPDTEWQCETLTVNVHAMKPDGSSLREVSFVTVLPLLPRVKQLTVTTEKCPVLLDREMLNLTELTIPSLKSLGPNLKCPALKRIRFTDFLSVDAMMLCLDRATYEAIGARPKDIIFAFHHQLHTMTWDVAPGENEMLSLEKLMEAGDGSSVIRE